MLTEYSFILLTVLFRAVEAVIQVKHFTQFEFSQLQHLGVCVGACRAPHQKSMAIIALLEFCKTFSWL